MTQNLYPPGNYARTISLNCLNVVLFRNHKDARQVLTFGSQILPGQSKFFLKTHSKKRRTPYGYLLLDLCPHTDKEYQWRTNIFPNEDCISAVKMSGQVAQYSGFLNFLYIGNPEQSKGVIQCMSNPQLDVLCLTASSPE